MNNSITVDALMVEALVDCLIKNSEFNPMETEEQKLLSLTTNRVLNAAVTTLSARMQRAGYDATPAGQHGLDPSKSSYL
jgi:hypothetical protein